MSTFARFAVVFQGTIAVAIGAFFYQQIFREHLLEFAPTSGPFAAPVGVIEYVVPIVLLTIEVTLITWMIYGSVQEERAAQRRRVRP